MIDFLANLIDRAQSRAPTLERRQRALFEAAPIAGSAPLETTAAVVSERSERAEVPAAGFTEGPAFSREASRRPQIERPVSHLEAAPPRRDSEREMPLSRPRQQAREVEVSEATRRPTAASVAISAERAQRPARRMDETSLERRSVNRNPIRAETQSATVGRPARGESTSAKQENRAFARTEPQVPAARANVTSSRNQSSLPPVVSRPRPRALDATQRPATAILLAKARSEKSAPPRAMPAPPPVHISIGRVEVRATPAAKPAARTGTRTGPHLRLDDYLTGRTRGTR